MLKSGYFELKLNSLLSVVYAIMCFLLHLAIRGASLCSTLSYQLVLDGNRLIF